MNKPLGSTLVLWNLPHMGYTENPDENFSSSITISLVYVHSRSYYWYQEGTIDYSLKICPMSPVLLLGIITQAKT